MNDVPKRSASVGSRETGAPAGRRVRHLQRPSKDREDILFGRPDRLKVFISSEMRSRSLERERCAAADAVEEHPDAQAWMWELSANAGPYSSLEVCRGHAATSDLLLLIVSNTLTDATELEWRTAKDAGASCAIFIKQEVKRDTRLTAFIEAERQTAIYVEFRDAADLKNRVGETLRQSHTSAIRKGVLQRRRVVQIGSVGNSPSRLFDAALESAEQELWAGSAVVAAELIAELENLFGNYEDGRENLDLLSGRVHATLGERARATEAYERVVTRPDRTPIGAAVAQQNLGLEALKRRDFVLARELMEDAIRQHLRCENWFGVLQMLLNLATLAVKGNQLASVNELADLAEQLMAEFSEPLPYQEASLWGLRGLIAAHGGRPSEALELFRHAWKRAKQLGDREASCVYAQNIGSAHADLGRPAIAVKWYRRALSIAKEADNVWRQEELHRALAGVAHTMGNNVSALEHLETARALASRMNDRWLVGTLTADIGAILALMGEHRAFGELDKASALFAEFDDARWLYRVEKNRGALARRSGDRRLAAESLGKALRYANSDNARREIHEGLAFLYLDKPIDKSAALEEFLTAFDCATQAGAADKAWLLGTYGTYLTSAGCPSEAIQISDLAISIAQSADDAEVAFHLRNNRGLALVACDDLEKARDVFQGGVNWARSEGKKALEVQALHNIGETQRRIGDLLGSRESLKRAVDLSEELGDSSAWRSALALLAMTEAAEGSLDGAELHAARVRDAARQVMDKANEATAMGTLAGVEFRRGNYHAAAEAYRMASRLNLDQPVHHCEDLMGIFESNAAADDWRRTLRAAHRVFSYAQEKSLQHIAWPSFLRATRWYINRGKNKYAGSLGARSIVLAFESAGPRQHLDSDSTAVTFDQPAEPGQIIQALLTLACYINSSSQDSALDVWEFLIDELAPDSEHLRDLIAIVQEAADMAAQRRAPG